jgi:glycosyltransferase involved in cell wall biosynthesis
MKVLLIGTDRKLFDENSGVFSRTSEYAKKVEELHVLIFTLKNEGHKFKKIGNLYLHPTNSLTKWFYVFNGKSLGSKITLDNKFIKDDSVISSQDPFQTGLVGLYLKSKFNFPFQVQIHTDFLSPHFRTSFLNKIRVRMSKKVIPRADGIRVVSSVVADSLKKEFPKLSIKPSVLPVFVDIRKILETPITRDLEKDFPQFKFTIFMASRLTKEKRFDIALQALKKVIKDYPHAGLVIAGDGPDKNNIVSLSKKLKIDKHIALIGWQNDLISYYKTCDTFLLTSEYEGYGMTLIEAGASGAMIVTTKVGIAQTSLFVDEHNSHICAVGDSECIANCIIGVIMDNQRRELFAHNIEEEIKKIAVSKEEYAEQYVNLLSGLLR